MTDLTTARGIAENCVHVSQMIDDSSTWLVCQKCVATALQAQREKDAKVCESVAREFDKDSESRANGQGDAIREAAAEIRSAGGGHE